jgi:hypothetical protein
MLVRWLVCWFVGLLVFWLLDAEVPLASPGG